MIVILTLSDRPMSLPEYLIVGLGNPGSKYTDTRHNVGFIAVDELARRWKESLSTEKWNALSCRMVQWDCRLTLIKPVTFMNLSGRAVAEYAKFYKIPVQNIIVVHDDLDMHPGRLKLVRGGGAGGHNGIKSITQSLGSNEFFRLKIGIGRPGKGDVHADFPVEKYVLSVMSAEEASLLEDRIASIEEGIRMFINDGPAKAMSIINSIK